MSFCGNDSAPVVLGFNQSCTVLPPVNGIAGLPCHRVRCEAGFPDNCPEEGPFDVCGICDGVNDTANIPACVSAAETEMDCAYVMTHNITKVYMSNISAEHSSELCNHSGARMSARDLLFSKAGQTIIGHAGGRPVSMSTTF